MSDIEEQFEVEDCYSCGEEMDVKHFVFNNICKGCFRMSLIDLAKAGCTINPALIRAAEEFIVVATELKKCSICNDMKELESFERRRNQCRDCLRERKRIASKREREDMEPKKPTTKKLKRDPAGRFI